jgi:hypothetical protein
MLLRKTVGKFKVNSEQCSICIRLSIDQCYCTGVINDNILKEKQQELQLYIEAAFNDGFKWFDSITQKSKMLFDSADAGKQKNKGHIDFEPSSAKAQSTFDKEMNKALMICLEGNHNKKRLQNLMHLPIEEKRQALKEFCGFKDGINRACLTMDQRGKARNIATLLAAERLIPCILHMKMRIIEKVFH